MQTRMVEYKGEQTEINVNDQTALVIDAVNAAKRGRFGWIFNHVSGTPGEKNCIKPAVSDICFLTNPRYDRYLTRKREAVQNMSLDAVAGNIRPERWSELREKAEKAKLNLTTLFETAKSELLTSIEKTETGDRNDGQRQGHDNCYARCENVTIHLATTMGSDGIMEPVFDSVNDKMTVEGCMLPFYVVRRIYRDRGEWKTVNSRPLTIMKDAIIDTTRLYDWKAFNLAKANFSAITFDSQTIFGFVRDHNTAIFDVVISEIVKDIGNLDVDPLTYLIMQQQVTVQV